MAIIITELGTRLKEHQPKDQHGQRYALFPLRAGMLSRDDTQPNDSDAILDLDAKLDLDSSTALMIAPQEVLEWLVGDARRDPFSMS